MGATTQRVPTDRDGVPLASSAVSAPGIAELGGSAGFTGSPPREPAETSHLLDVPTGTPCAIGGGSAGSAALTGGPAEAAARADRGVSDVPFATSTDEERACVVSITHEDHPLAGDDHDTFDRRGTPRDTTGWHCKAPPTPRPLYGLDRLAAWPDALVIVVEREEVADAAGLLFPNYVAVAPISGANALAETDWTLLQGRPTAIWPCNDPPGADFAFAVVDLLIRAGATCVRTVELPADWPTAWDLTDDLPDGVVPKRLQELVDDAMDDVAVEIPSGFKMTQKGLFFTPDKIGKSQEPSPVFIAGPF